MSLRKLVMFTLFVWVSGLAACGNPGGNNNNNNNNNKNCFDQCSEGTRQCTGNGWQECKIQSNGCADWGEVTACPTGQICSSGNCQKNCLNQCTLGAQQCAQNGFQKCEQKNTGCTDWSETTACEGGKICSGGKCVGSCTNQCTEGAKQCSGNGVQECKKASAGCTEWTTATACPGGQTCSGGNCTGQCTNQCTEGAKQCSGSNVQECQKQANGCTDWSNPLPCQGGQTCSGGQCTGQCSNQCAVGSKQCNGSGYQTCEQKPNGCTDWSSILNCTNGQICSGGNCVNSCVNQCTEGAQQCSGSGIQKCEKQNTGCTDWGSTIPCTTGQICSGGKCVSQCVNQCTLNSKQCSGSGVQTCEQKPSGCTDWSTTTPCTSGKICSGGNCVQSCVNQCTEGAKQCSGTGVQECKKQPTGCTDWDTPTPCTAGEICSGGRCVKNCANQCTEGAKQCSGTGVQTCEKKTTGCTDWGTAVPCPTGQTCSGGKCTSNCTNQCSENAERCNGTSLQKCKKLASGCTDWDTPQPCPNSGVCSNGTCGNAQCVKGDKRCNGTKVEECDTAGLWQVTQVCPQACAQGSCSVSAQCTAGTRRCNGKQVEECNPTGTAWLYVRACKVGCTNGLCTGGCTAGEKRCNGKTPETCKSDGSGWTASTACTTFCYKGTCAKQELKLVGQTVEMSGEHVYAGDVSLSTQSKIVVKPGNWLRIIAQNITIDTRSSIVVSTITGDDPAGRGGNYATCKPRNCTTRTARANGGGGGFGTAGLSNSSKVCCYSDPNYYRCGSSYNGSYNCTARSSGGKVHGGYVSNITTGSRGGSCTNANGGGMIDLIARKSITISGQSIDNLQANGGSAALGGGTYCGDGSGGGIRLVAEEVNVTNGVISAEKGGSRGGLGRIKILHGPKSTITATTKGTLEKSLMPPMDLSSSTHPDQTKYYNDNFPEFNISWTRPFGNLVGYYYKINNALPTSQSAVPNTQSTFEQGESISLPATSLKTGTNYFHAVSVGPNATFGTVESYFKILINSTPVTITSSSHKNQTQWFPGTSVSFDWTNPLPASNFSGYYYVFDRYKDTIPNKTDKFLPVSDNKLFLPNKPASSIWFLHVIAEDTRGYLTKQAAHYKVMIGPDPGKGSVLGDVREDTSSNKISGVKIVLNRGLHEQTSQSDGTYSFLNAVYEGTYELKATHKCYEDFVKQVSVTKAQNTIVTVTMKKKAGACP